jgi:hypothetical protein
MGAQGVWGIEMMEENEFPFAEQSEEDSPEQ